MKTVLTNTIFSLVCALVIFGFGEQLQLDRKLTRFACISTFLLEFVLCIDSAGRVLDVWNGS
jgi:hypothetical protein